MSTLWLTAAVLLTTLTSAAFSQVGRLGESCDLASQGANETKTFLAFDQELHGAFSKQDAGIIALLVTFPLRVNDDRGSYYLKDPTSLQARFQDIFPAAVRRAVLDQSPRTLFCNYAGIMYGDGVIWVTRTDRGYGIMTVNIPTTRSSPWISGLRVEFACQTEKDRIIVDEVSGAASRYRAWHKPHSLLDKPDAEIASGEKSIQGTGSCAHPVWTFTEGQTKVVVEGLGCSGDEQPKDAVGTLESATNNRPGVTSWCF